MGKNVANPMAMLLACAAVLEYAGDPQAARAAQAIRQTTLSVAADGIRTFDLGAEASTSEVVDEVLARLNRASASMAPIAKADSRGVGG
jgi:isocitrate/isopropylmalate dehydrogenase